MQLQLAIQDNSAQLLVSSYPTTHIRYRLVTLFMMHSSTIASVLALYASFACALPVALQEVFIYLVEDFCRDRTDLSCSVR